MFSLVLSILLAGLLIAGCAPATPTSSASGAAPAPAGGVMAAPATGERAGVLAAVNGQPVGINVAGEGSVRARPDLAIIQVGVEARARTAQEAQQQVAAAMDAVVSRLKQAGVDASDIRTLRVGLHPIIENERGQQRQAGFQAFNSVAVNVRKVDQTGQILDAVVAAGGNRIEGVSFTLADPSALRAQAREKAVEDARQKADQLARLAGVRLGGLIYLAESGVAPPPVIRREMAALAAPAAAATPIEPGELEVRSSVQVTYGIQ